MASKYLTWLGPCTSMTSIYLYVGRNNDCISGCCDNIMISAHLDIPVICIIVIAYNYVSSE